MTPERSCPACGNRFPEDRAHFYWLPSKGDWSYHCIDCAKAYGREYRRRRRERDPGYVERQRQESLAWAAANRRYVRQQSYHWYREHAS